MVKAKKPVKKSQGEVYYPKIAVIGIGGGGGSIVSEISKLIHRKKIPHLNKINFVIANVDMQAIKQAPTKTKSLFFGKELTKGLGAGMNPEIGEKAALLAKKKIEKIIQGNDLCILVSCFGGGTGSGASPVFAQIANDLNVLTWGIFTKPFSFEGRERARISSNALNNVKDKLNAYTVIPNQRIFKIVDEKTSVNKSLSTMNTVLAEILTGLIETLYLPGLINLDFSDIRAVLKNEHGLSYLHSESATGVNRADKALEGVLKNPLIEYDIKGADKILFNIIGSKDLKMSEVEKISKTIYEFNPQARIIFGINQDNSYKNKLKITLIALGCAKKEKPKPKKKKRKPKIVVIQKPKPEPKPKKKKKKKVIKIKERKPTLRRNALDVHKQAEEDVQKMLDEESKWDIPAFLREK